MMMTTTHTLYAFGVCPENKARDCYKITVRVTDNDNGGEPLLVETIQREALSILSEPIHQETLTRASAESLLAAVETECRHGDVLTVCEARP